MHNGNHRTVFFCAIPFDKSWIFLIHQSPILVFSNNIFSAFFSLSLESPSTNCASIKLASPPHTFIKASPFFWQITNLRICSGLRLTIKIDRALIGKVNLIYNTKVMFVLTAPLGLK